MHDMVLAMPGSDQLPDRLRVTVPAAPLLYGTFKVPLRLELPPGPLKMTVMVQVSPGFFVVPEHCRRPC